ncbi:hypothetical protein EV363DRAFT_1324353 [Boletus edulis]|uniref:BTB domain-containing protein n=1 Tax=Boletus edulis BED1 TaxID=1328754 RepID=A0AAD4GG63_BOLED|nr:hypothetical protein EV363DRAFT_1324353 [Boletus edulis]KAF8443030.1 hypothetical protein L210DRAFT_3534690 [Boletus edulis BED1]
MDDGNDTHFILTEHDVDSVDPVDAPSPKRGTSPLTKRPRCQDSRSSLSGADSSDPSSRISQESDGPSRDPEYYLTDGSCILRVENTLFNVHRSILSADSSSFSTLFTLPQGNITAEGTSDDNPIVLHGDTPEEFRNFLWSLYALPHEIIVVRGPHLDLDRFIDIAKVASKYSFKSIETWALDAIQDFIERKPSPLLDPMTIGFPFSADSPPATFLESKRQISRLVQVAQMCGHASLLETMVTLLRQLMSASLHFSYLAMSLADDLNLRELRGMAYLEVLQRSVFICGRDANGNVLMEGDVHEGSDGLERIVVSPAQQLRLLSGYLRLTKAWERLRAIPPSFEHAPLCGTTWHQHGCTQSWSDFWKEKTRSDGVVALGPTNVIGKLQAILKEVDKWGSATYMHHECKLVAKRAVQESVKQINNSLADFFYEGGEY